MYSDISDNILSGIIKSAFDEFADEMFKNFPPDDILDEMYPIPKKSLRKSQRKYKEHMYKKPLPILYLQRIAVIILAISTVFFCVLASSPEVRAVMSETVVEWFDKYLKIDFGSSQQYSIESENVDTLVIGYIPKELELISSEETLYARDYMYTAENGDYLILGIYTTESVSVGADIEFSEYEIININDNNAYMVYDVIERTGTLVTGNEHYTIYMTGILDKGELIKIAENIK